MKHPGRTILLILAVEGLIVLNWQFPVVRFSIQWLNDLLLLQVLLAPAFVMLILARNIQLLDQRKAVRTTAMVGGTILATLSFIFLGFMIVGFFTISPTTMLDKCEPIALSPRVSVHIYRFSFLESLSGAYLVRQELTLLPGVVLVRELEQGRKFQERSAFCDSLRSKISERRDLKPYVYF